MSRKTEVALVARRRYWREADGRVMVEAWQSSGERLSEFADRHRVDPRRIARWASRLGRPEPEAVHFHPVRLAGEGPGSWSGSGIEIHLVGGRRVRVAPGLRGGGSAARAGGAGRGGAVLTLPASVRIYIAAEAVDDLTPSL